MAVLFLEIEPGMSDGMMRQLADKHGIYPVRFYPNLSQFMGTDIWRTDAPPGLNILSLRDTPGLIYGEPDEEHIFAAHLWRDVYPFGTPNMALPSVLDEAAGSRSALPEILDMIDVTRAHRAGITGTGTIILIVDTGINGGRLPEEVRVGGWTDDSDGNPWSDPTGHGTMVAMIAHAVAPGAGIFSVKMRPGPNGGLMKESVMNALDDLLPTLAGQIVIMNNSWGTPGCKGEDYWCAMIPSRVVWNLISRDMLSVVMAAGNSNVDCGMSQSEVTPSILCINSLPGAYIVGAVDRQGQPLYYSSRGPGQCSELAPTLSAPTFGILPWGKGWIDTAAQGGGTSACTPQVSGVIALLRSVYPEASTLHSMTTLAITARRTQRSPQSQIEGATYDYATGFGIVQGMAAIEAYPTHFGHHYHRLITKSILAAPQIHPLPVTVKG